MMAYFQPPDWQMMDSQQSAQTPESQKPKTPKSETSIKEKNNKMPQEPAQEATEELDILHGRMMLLAALKVAGTPGS